MFGKSIFATKKSITYAPLSLGEMLKGKIVYSLLVKFDPNLRKCLPGIFIELRIGNETDVN